MNKQNKKEALGRAYTYALKQVEEKMEAQANFFRELQNFISKHGVHSVPDKYKGSIMNANNYVYWRKDNRALQYVVMSAKKMARTMVKKDGVDKWLHP